MRDAETTEVEGEGKGKTKRMGAPYGRAGSLLTSDLLAVYFPNGWEMCASPGGVKSKVLAGSVAGRWFL